MRLLVQHGLTQNKRHLVGFFQAELDEKAKVVRILIRHGVDATVRDQTEREAGRMRVVYFSDCFHGPAHVRLAANSISAQTHIFTSYLSSESQ